MQKDILKYFAYQFFSNLDFARGIFVIYLTGKGLSGSEIGLIQTILFVSSMIFEVPAGIFADKFSKKLSIILGLIICTIVPLSILGNDVPELFYVIFFFLGLGYSMERGADVALLYERLQEGGESWVLKFKKILGKARAVRYSALALAIAAGGGIQNLGWNFVFISVSVCMMLASIFIILYNEAPKKVVVKTDGKKSSFFGISSNLKQFLLTRRGKILLLLTLVSAFVQAASTPFFIYSQLLFKDYGLDNTYIGFIIAAGLVSTSLCSAFAYKIKMKNEIQLCFTMSVILIFTLSAFFFRPPVLLAATLFVISQGLPSLILIHLSEIFNSEIPSDIRTTCLSLQNLIGASILSATNLIFGLLIDKTSIYWALGSFAILPLISLVFLIFYRYMKKTDAK